MNLKRGQKNCKLGLLVENDSFLIGHCKINVLNETGRNLGIAERIWERMDNWKG